jgi:hypothetical protein
MRLILVLSVLSVLCACTQAQTGGSRAGLMTEAAANPAVEVGPSPADGTLAEVQQERELAGACFETISQGSDLDAKYEDARHAVNIWVDRMVSELGNTSIRRREDIFPERGSRSPSEAHMGEIGRNTTRTRGEFYSAVRKAQDNLQIQTGNCNIPRFGRDLEAELGFYQLYQKAAGSLWWTYFEMRGPQRSDMIGRLRQMKWDDHGALTWRTRRNE